MFITFLDCKIQIDIFSGYNQKPFLVIHHIFYNIPGYSFLDWHNQITVKMPSDWSMLCNGPHGPHPPSWIDTMGRWGWWNPLFWSENGGDMWWYVVVSEFLKMVLEPQII